MNVVDSQKHPAVRPTKTTLFLRSFLPWQLIRFILINIRMSFMIMKSHGRKLPKKKE